jgi:hypothetical protein
MTGPLETLDRVMHGGMRIFIRERRAAGVTQLAIAEELTRKYDVPIGRGSVRQFIADHDLDPAGSEAK